MTLGLDAIKRNLTDEELVFFEADAAARGMSETTYAAMCIREGLAAYERGELEFDRMTTH
jgi:hypothetical protein